MKFFRMMVGGECCGLHSRGYSKCEEEEKKFELIYLIGKINGNQKHTDCLYTPQQQQYGINPI